MTFRCALLGHDVRQVILHRSYPSEFILLCTRCFRHDLPEAGHYLETTRGHWDRLEAP